MHKHYIVRTALPKDKSGPDADILIALSLVGQKLISQHKSRATQPIILRTPNKQRYDLVYFYREMLQTKQVSYDYWVLQELSVIFIGKEHTIKCRFMTLGTCCHYFIGF